MALKIFLDDKSFHCLKQSIPSGSHSKLVVEQAVHLNFFGGNTVVSCQEPEARNLLLYAGHCPGVVASIHKALLAAGLPIEALKTDLKHEEYSTVHKNKILIVEDNSDIRKLLVLRLKELGYEVFEAATGLDAFRQARATSPDLILMDLTMPLVGGDEVMGWLKTDLLTRHIPVIVTTALLFGPAVDRAIATGAAEVIYKPFDFDTLHIALQRHLPLPSAI